VDAAYYDELRGRVYALFVVVTDRLSVDCREMVAEFLDRAEYGLAVEWMAATLAETKAALSDDERTTFRALSEIMGGLNLPAAVT
jgi:hypothetical protein